jgi:integrase
MALKKLGHNKWHVRVSVRDNRLGYPISKQTTVAGTHAEAATVEAEILKELQARCSLTSYASTFGDAVDLYMKKLHLQGKLSKQHEEMVNFVRRELGHTHIEEFADRFTVYRKHLLATPTAHGKARGSASINRYTSIVRAVFNHLVEIELIDKNPITAFKFPKLAEQPRDRYLAQEERLRLLNTIQEYRPEILPIIQYMMAVPCRVSELTEAKREQYSMFTRTIYIPDSKAGIPIHKPVPEEMTDYFNSIPSDCPYLFYQRLDDGEYRSLSHLRYAWSYCLKKAGILNLRIHDLRHIAATDLYEAGNAERAIMDIAGWKTAMLSTYRHKDSFRSAQKMVFAPKVTTTVGITQNTAPDNEVQNLRLAAI